VTDSKKTDTAELIHRDQALCVYLDTLLNDGNLTITQKEADTEEVPRQEHIPEFQNNLTDQRPDWATARFKALSFKIGNLRLTTPLCHISRTIDYPLSVSQVPGQPEWVIGIAHQYDYKITLINSDVLLFKPGEYRESNTSTPVYNSVLIDADGKWGFPCDEVLKLQFLRSDQIHWLKNPCGKNWRLGTVIDNLSCLIDIPQLISRKL